MQYASMSLLKRVVFLAMVRILAVAETAGLCMLFKALDRPPEGHLTAAKLQVCKATRLCGPCAKPDSLSKLNKAATMSVSLGQNEQGGHNVC